MVCTRIQADRKISSRPFLHDLTGFGGGLGRGTIAAEVNKPRCSSSLFSQVDKIPACSFSLFSHTMETMGRSPTASRFVDLPVFPIWEAWNGMNRFSTPNRSIPVFFSIDHFPPLLEPSQKSSHSDMETEEQKGWTQGPHGLDLIDRLSLPMPMPILQETFVAWKRLLIYDGHGACSSAVPGMLKSSEATLDVKRGDWCSDRKDRCQNCMMLPVFPDDGDKNMAYH